MFRWFLNRLYRRSHRSNCRQAQFVISGTEVINEMKILNVITSLRTAGAERLVVDLSRRMAKAGDEVEVLVFDGTRTLFYEELESAGIKVHSLGIGSRAMHNPLLAFRFRRFLKRNHYDIVHAHNTPCQVTAAIAAPRRVLVTTEHNTFNRRRKYAFLRPFDRWMYSRYRHIICVNEETRRELSRWLRSDKLDARMSVVSNGIDLDFVMHAKPFHALAADTRFKILMISSFRPQKDHMTLIRAMQYLPEDCSLTLAGGAELPAHKAIMADCQQAVVDLGLDDRIHFLGIRRDVAELVKACDAVVLSSRHEGQPISIIEAMAAGKPVLASDVNGLKDIVGGAGILFPCGDSEKLAEEIKGLYEDPEKAREIGARCLERARQFDIGKTADCYR